MKLRFVVRGEFHLLVLKRIRPGVVRQHSNAASYSFEQLANIICCDLPLGRTLDLEPDSVLVNPFDMMRVLQSLGDFFEGGILSDSHGGDCHEVGVGERVIIEGHICGFFLALPMMGNSRWRRGWEQLTRVIEGTGGRGTFVTLNTREHVST